MACVAVLFALLALLALSAIIGEPLFGVRSDMSYRRADWRIFLKSDVPEGRRAVNPQIFADFCFTS